MILRIFPVATRKITQVAHLCPFKISMQNDHSEEHLEFSIPLT